VIVSLIGEGPYICLIQRRASLRQAKIEQLDALLRHQNIGGFQIAVRDALPMRRIQRVQIRPAYSTAFSTGNRGNWPFERRALDSTVVRGVSWRSEQPASFEIEYLANRAPRIGPSILARWQSTETSSAEGGRGLGDHDRAGCVVRAVGTILGYVPAVYRVQNAAAQRCRLALFFYKPDCCRAVEENIELVILRVVIERISQEKNISWIIFHHQNSRRGLTHAFRSPAQQYHRVGMRR
jgi:hypothetical protein